MIDLQVFDIVGRLISCMVTVFIVFQYFDAKYVRVYQSKAIYISWKMLCWILNFLLYLLNNPVVNLSFWITVVTISGKVLYYDEVMSRTKYYFTHISFMLANAICEAVGSVLVDAGTNFVYIYQNEAVIAFVYNIGSSASAILLYYLVLQRIFIKNDKTHITVGQYALYILITVYMLVNIGEILFMLKYDLSDKDYLFLMFEAVFMIFINLYLFYLLDTFAENKDLKYKLALYEQQAESNYEYYAKQIENHQKALAVIHDVRKHMRIVEEYGRLGADKEQEAYAASFDDMIAPLLMKQYCRNAILNMILNDKQEECEKEHILFQVKIADADIEFMEQIDVTTIFGNILDNAIEACVKAEEKRIEFQMYPFNGLVYVKISNTYTDKIIWSADRKPLSTKGQQHGIGLSNVEKVLQKYNGDIEFAIQDNQFVLEIMFNKIESLSE